MNTRRDIQEAKAWISNATSELLAADNGFDLKTKIDELRTELNSLESLVRKQRRRKIRRGEVIEMLPD
jgi:hypothetical protein